MTLCHFIENDVLKACPSTNQLRSEAMKSMAYGFRCPLDVL